MASFRLPEYAQSFVDIHVLEELQFDDIGPDERIQLMFFVQHLNKNQTSLIIKDGPTALALDEILIEIANYADDMSEEAKTSQERKAYRYASAAFSTVSTNIYREF